MNGQLWSTEFADLSEREGPDEGRKKATVSAVYTARLSISRVLPILAATSSRTGPSLVEPHRRQRLGVARFEIIEREARALDDRGAAFVQHRGRSVRRLRSCRRIP